MLHLFKASCHLACASLTCGKLPRPVLDSVTSLSEISCSLTHPSPPPHLSPVPGRGNYRRPTALLRLRSSRHGLIMGVTRTTHVDGTGPRPTRGNTVTIAYTGWLKDTSKPGNKGQKSASTPDVVFHIHDHLLTRSFRHRFDTTSGGDDFIVQIGMGKLIRGKPQAPPLQRQTNI